MPLVLLHDEHNNRWLEFRKPIQILSTKDLSDVQYYLRQIESMVEYHNAWAVGFLSYEASPAFDKSMAVKGNDEAALPILWFGIFNSPAEVQPPTSYSDGRFSLGDWTAEIPKKDYLASVERVKEYIREGDTYQVNFTYRQAAEFEGDPRSLFHTLSARQPGGYGCLIDTQDFTVVSVSPELFFRLDNGRVVVRPMKGTFPRGATPDRDEANAEELHRSEKNRAENLMIVDMMRNDLNRIARPGTVTVPKLFTIERYPTVLQMTSTVEAETDHSWAEILSALFPCASITGAPKIRTMQLIEKLEASPRGVYTGSIGFLAPGGISQMSVAIRTVTIDKTIGVARYGIGGGIVSDSDPEDEFAESRIKAAVLDHVPATTHPVELFETMRYEPGAGISRIERHVQRLSDSAEYFGLQINVSDILKRLDMIVHDHPLRVRLVCGPGAEVHLSHSIISGDDSTRAISAIAASSPIDSNNPLLYHKTTNRELYDTARSTDGGYDDTLLYNEHGEITEFTIGNVVLEIDGRFVTPPIRCGLLPGTLRQELLDAGKIHERVVRVSELSSETSVFRINSVRGWQRVDMTLRPAASRQ